MVKKKRNETQESVPASHSEEKKEVPQSPGPEEEKTKYALMFLTLFLVIIAVAVILWIAPKPSIDTGKNANNTTITPTNQSLSVIDAGDTVWLSYDISYVNGTMIENGTTATEEGRFGSISLLGLTAGVEIKRQVEASELYGEYGVYDVRKIIPIPRQTTLPRIFTVDELGFRSVFGVPNVNQTYYNESVVPWPITVVATNGTHVELRHDPSNETILPTPYWNERIIVNETNLTRVIENVTVGSVIQDYWMQGIVVNVTETNITIDFNTPFAGKMLNLTLKIHNVTKMQKRDVPSVELFVVSYCPYGLQMERAFIPVAELLQGKADMKVKFLPPMHGEQEEKEDNLQICLREEHPQSFWPYLRCFVESGQSAACLSKVGLTQDQLSSCTSTVMKYKQNDYASVTKYRITGSPTLVINGKIVTVNRTPEAIKQAICKAFSDEKRPSECNQVLSNNPVGAGFGPVGGGGQAAGQNAQCG